MFKVWFPKGRGEVSEIGGSVIFGCNEEMMEPLSIFDSGATEMILPAAVVFLFELLVTPGPGSEPGPGLGCRLWSLGGIMGAVVLIWSTAG